MGTTGTGRSFDDPRRPFEGRIDSMTGRTWSRVTVATDLNVTRPLHPLVNDIIDLQYLSKNSCLYHTEIDIGVMKFQADGVPCGEPG
jgi:hypothetical protein